MSQWCLLFRSPLHLDMQAGPICHRLSARSFRSWIPHRNYSSWTGLMNRKSERGEKVSLLKLMGCVERTFKSPDHHPGSLYITAHHSWTWSSHRGYGVHCRWLTIVSLEEQPCNSILIKQDHTMRGFKMGFPNFPAPTVKSHCQVRPPQRLNLTPKYFHTVFVMLVCGLSRTHRAQSVTENEWLQGLTHKLQHFLGWT